MTTQVVTVGQPQEGTKGTELQMMAPPPGMGTTIVMPFGLPPGLAYLQSLNEVLIHQHFDLLEGNCFCLFVLGFYPIATVFQSYNRGQVT